jgi:C-terminal processing protease CtpA/Prc
MATSFGQISSFLTLSEFNSKIGKLTLNDLKTIAEQALIMLEEAYVHLPLKIAMYAVDPCQRLRILRRRLDQPNPLKNGLELNFHKEMLDIFISLRDLHTNYLLPEPYSNHFAILPFLIESFIEERQTKFLVTQVGIPDYLKSLFPPNFDPKIPSTFKRGVEIKYWNGVPIERAVEINADKNAGSNPAARFARGLESMTLRPMVLSLPPDEEWVIIGYRREDGIEMEYKQPWIIASVQRSMSDKSESFDSGNRYKIGVDLTTDLVREMKETLFAPDNVRQSDEVLANARSIDDLISSTEGIKSNFPKILEAKKISDDIGYLRLYTFYPRAPVSPKHVFDEFIRLILQLPKKGLILDMRGNGGGYIWLAESILQLLTPREILPEPYQFISSPLILEMTENSMDPEIQLWKLSLSESVATGSTYSRGLTLTPSDQANSIGQIYHGPVILITDALCYSATDLFAAGFQDHHIGTILGVDGNTGAGGANVWNYEDLRYNLKGTRYELKKLPSNSNMNVSIRRNVRVGENAGTPVEDLGVPSDIPYSMTRLDQLEKNINLIEKAVEILSKTPLRQLDVKINTQDTTVQVELNTFGITRIDLYIDERPFLSQDIGNGINNLSLNGVNPDSKVIKIVGLNSNEIVALRKIRIHLPK